MSYGPLPTCTDRGHLARCACRCARRSLVRFAIRPDRARRGGEIEDARTDRDARRDLAGRRVDAQHVAAAEAADPDAPAARGEPVGRLADVDLQRPEPRRAQRRRDATRIFTGGVSPQILPVRVDVSRSSDRPRRRPRVDEDRRDEQHGDADEALADQAPPDPRQEAGVGPVERRPDDEVVERAPEQRDAHERRSSRAAPGRSCSVQRSCRCGSRTMLR